MPVLTTTFIVMGNIFFLYALSIILAPHFFKMGKELRKKVNANTFWSQKRLSINQLN